jgi:transposase, IS6 family
MTDARAFRGFRFPAEVVLWAVRWYLQFPISYRDLERMLADRGVAVDHVSLYRWVQRFAPELEKRLRRHLRPCRGLPPSCDRRAPKPIDLLLLGT